MRGPYQVIRMKRSNASRVRTTIGASATGTAANASL